MIQMQMPYNHCLHILDIVPRLRNLRRERHGRIVVHPREDVVYGGAHVGGVVLSRPDIESALFPCPFLLFMLRWGWRWYGTSGCRRPEGSTYIPGACLIEHEAFGGVLDKDGQHDEFAAEGLWAGVRERGGVACALEPAFVGFEVAHVEELDGLVGENWRRGGR